jgi:hypothetical protein
MKCPKLLPLLFGAVLFTTLLNAQSYKAVLTGRGEVPPIVTTAHGVISAELKADTLIVSGSFTGLTGDLAVNIAGGAHIHMAYAGRNGGVIFPLNIDVDSTLRNGVFSADSNRFVLSAGQMAALHERALYVNVHSLPHASGELRGQLVPDVNASYATVMFGSYENGLVLSGGQGALVLDLEEDTLTVSGSVNGLSTPVNVNIGGGMHLHGALTGQNGGIQMGLTLDLDTTGMNGIVSAAKNVFTLTAEQKVALEGRRLYANVHTMKYGPGELRGQVTPVADAVFRAHLSGMNEVPFVATKAAGMVIAEFNTDSSIVVSGSFDGISSGIATQIAGGAHIHIGVAGRNGGIQFPIDLTLNGDSTGAEIEPQIFVLNAAQFDALMSRGLYVNVHSNSVNSGEIRGQLLPESQMTFNANLSSVTSIPAVRSSAAGLIKAELTGNMLTLTGSFSGLLTDVDTSIAGGAHIHIAAAGSTGPVIFPLNLRFNGDLSNAILSQNRFMLDDDQLKAVIARGLYVNVHTTGVQSGEIRGQLLPDASTYFFASLAGSNETNPVKTTAFGQLVLEVHRGGQITASGSFNNLSSELATNIAGGVHIHTGLLGQNGPVLIPIASETSVDLRSGVFNSEDNVFQVSLGLIDTLYSTGHYVNLHSSVHASGELRGQLLPAANAHFSAVLRSANEVQPIASNAHGSVNAILSGNQLRVTGSFADLDGDFASNIAGGSHIHGGFVGTNAGIAVGLKTMIAGDLKSGIFRADTTYEVTQPMVRALLSGGMYVNVHSTLYTSGELRGQILSSFNAFPNATSEITSPTPGGTITVNSASQEPLVVTWSPSSDADSLAYIIEVAGDPTFNLVLVELNVGGELSFSALTLGFVDTLLAGLGIPFGFPVPVYARITASDGSLQSTGEGSQFNVVRAMPSAVTDLPEGWEFSAYPTLTQRAVTIALEAPRSETGKFSVALISPTGQRMHAQALEGFGSSSFGTSVDISSLSPGVWVVGLFEDGQMISQKRIIVVR